LIPGWYQLEHDEQEALLLVDDLQKSYQDAAVILNNSASGVARVVAQGSHTEFRNPTQRLPTGERPNRAS